MTAPKQPDTATPAPCTLAGVMHGARMIVPILPTITAFGAAFGAAASQKGLTLIEAGLMSGLVYAGASQLVALELWRGDWTLAALAAVAAVTATVNARLILMSASLQPWMAASPTALNAFNLFFLTDASWILGTRYHVGGGRDLGVLLGAGSLLWVIWIAATLPGHIAGSLLTDPKSLGLDLVMPIFFAAMLVPLWKGVRPALPWMVAGIVGVGVSAVGGGYLFIVAGALAGAATGAFFDDRN
jgi:predicted branched-subunit amino acid permease